jgi:hypothetical protein
MVHALEEIKRLLRPDASLIDIHPLREAPIIQVHSAGGVVFAEPSSGYDYDDDLRHADDALTLAVDRDVFVLDGSHDFGFVTYASSVVELRDFLAVAGAYDEGPRDQATQVKLDELYAWVEAVMTSSGEKAKVSHRERARMTQLIPVR